MLGARSVLCGDVRITLASFAADRARRPLGAQACAAHAQRTTRLDGSSACAYREQWTGQVVRFRTQADRSGRLVGMEGRKTLAGSVVCAGRVDDGKAREFSARVRSARSCSWPCRDLDSKAVPLDSGQAQREYLLGAARAMGITQARWIADYFRTGARSSRMPIWNRSLPPAT